GSNKRIENLLFHFRWNSWAGVLDLHDHSASLLSAIRTNPEDQGSALFPYGLAGIQYEIIENLLTKLFIHHGGRQIRSIITLDIDPICYPLLGQRLQRPFNQSGQLLRTKLQLRWTGKIHEAADQRAQPVYFSIDIAGELFGQGVRSAQFLVENLC